MADALFRREETSVGCVAISTIVQLWIQEMISSYEGDTEVEKII